MVVPKLIKVVHALSYGPPRSVLSVSSVPSPPLPTGDQVMVRVHAASANAADWHVTRGDPFLLRLAFGIRRPGLQALGRDCSGVVVAVGPLVRRFSPGDRVCGDIDGGGFSEYVVRSQDRFALVPGGVSHERAAAAGMAAQVALQAIIPPGERKNGKKRKGKGGNEEEEEGEEGEYAISPPGARVLVVGVSGGVGSSAAQIARLLGAGRVDGVCGPASADKVRSAGWCDRVFDYTTEDYIAEAKEGGAEAGYDLVIDCAVHRPLSESRDILRDGGRFVMVGQTRGWSFVASMLKLKWLSGHGKTLGAMMQENDPGDMARILGWIEEGKFEPFVSSVKKGIEGAVEAIVEVDEDHPGGKIVVQIHDEDEDED